MRYEDGDHDGASSRVAALQSRASFTPRNSESQPQEDATMFGKIRIALAAAIVLESSAFLI
jgi:hypothetical protein